MERATPESLGRESSLEQDFSAEREPEPEPFTDYSDIADSIFEADINAIAAAKRIVIVFMSGPILECCLGPNTRNHGSERPPEWPLAVTRRTSPLKKRDARSW